MKLISCHIDGFGKLNNVDMSFEEGLNVIREDNGFGKTTLATFIKVMLYGFEDETKKSLQDKEREKYRPWNKGLYGGRLRFETEGVEYEVSRMFGKNENDDAFEVRDVSTNMVVDLFEKTELGNQIFGIDRNSFFRTAYIASRDFNKRDEKVTDSIRAKLGNLTDATDDINNYENVCNKIDKKMLEYSPDRKTGKIKNLKVSIQEMEAKCGKIDEYEKAIEVNEIQLGRLNEIIEADKDKILKYEEEKKSVQKYHVLREKRATYNSLIEELEESQKIAKQTEEYFNGEIPTAEDISNAKSNYFETRQLIKQMNDNHFYKDEKWEENEKRFANGIPKEEEVKEYIKLTEAVKDGRSNILNMSTVLDREVEDYCTLKKTQTEEDNKKTEEDTNKKNANKKKWLMILLIVGIICVAAGVVCLVLSNLANMILMIAGGASIVIGLILLVLIFILKLNRKEEIKLKEMPVIDKSEALNNSEKVAKIEKEIKDAEYENQILEGQISQFLAKYGYEYNRENVVNTLLDLMKEVSSYTEGVQKLNRYESLCKECEEKEKITDDFFAKIGADKNLGAERIFDDVQTSLVRREEANQEINRKRAKIVQYEADNDIGEILKEIPDDLRSLEDIQDDIDDISEEYEKDKDNLSRQRLNIDEIEGKKKALLELKNEKEALEEKMISYERNYNLMKYTKEFLTKAKDGLSNKYTGPTMKAFTEYCNMFNAESDKYRIDTNFEMTKLEEGLQRKIRDLSSGQKDLTDLCLRLALIEAMYEQEKPFLILDDPFVNFDDDNLSKAKDMMDSVSKEYQVIYFTCHESRGGKQ